MSPIRRDNDFQRTELEDWDTWVQEQIQEAQGRGEFDNLPDAGKPIKIWRTEVNPEYDLAFSRMKNADVLPVWMELDRDVSRLSQELDDFLERSTAWLLFERDEAIRAQTREAPAEPSAPAPKRPWWQIWQRLMDWFRIEPNEPDSRHEPRSIGDLLRLREHIRAQYLARAAALDKKIESYHNSLPEGLSHLQRLRMLPDRAARRFDARFPVRLLLVESLDDVDHQEARSA